MSVVCATDSILRYEFELDACKRGIVHSVSTELDVPLHRDPVNTTCSEGNLGIESHENLILRPNDQLHGSLEPLLTHLRDSPSPNGISFSFWIKSLQYDNARTPIFTIADSQGPQTVNKSAITECDWRGVNLQLLLQNETLELLYRTSDSYFEPCQRTRLTQLSLPAHQLVHLSIVLTDRHQQIFVNGQESVTMNEPFHPSLLHWCTSSRVKFFDHLDMPTWYGRIYQFEIFDKPLTKQDILSVMSLGLPPTIPVAHSTTLTINEDAEIVAGSHPVSWYEYPTIFSETTSSEFPVMDLSISFLAFEVEELLDSLGLNHTKPHNIYTYINKPPDGGDLFLSDGTSVTMVAPQDLITLHQTQIVFIPKHNAHSTFPSSTYTTFEFCVSLYQIFSPTQCQSTAKVNIIVESVNDPPIALVASPQPYIVYEGTGEAEVPLQLTGADVDQVDKITAVEIVSLPKLGYLFLSVPVRRADGLFHGTLLSDMNYFIEGQEALVEYKYSAADHIVRGSSATDSFEFRVRDSNGVWSNPTEARIQIMSRVENVVSSLPVIVREGDKVIAPLQGIDRSGLNRTLGYFLETTPDDDIGHLISQGGESLTSDTMLSVRLEAPYEQFTGLEFIPSSSVCDGVKSVEASFSYRSVAYSDEEYVSSVSQVTQQDVTIECKVDPIVLSVPQNTIQVDAFDRIMSDPCSGYMFDPSTINMTECPVAIVLGDVRVVTTSAHTEKAHVTLKTENGKLTVAPRFRNSIHWEIDIPVMRSSIQFLASPGNLSQILSNLHFQSAMAGPDQVNITIDYGQCEETNEFGCFVVEASVNIEVLPATPVEPELLFANFPWKPLPLTLTLILLIKFKGKGRVLMALRKEEARDTSLDDDTMDDTTMIRWHEYYDEEEGMCYYKNTETEEVTWDPPLEEEYIRVDGTIGNADLYSSGDDSSIN